MKENKYDNKHFFDQYNQMPRSVNGLAGAGEWHILKKMLPELNNKRVLDLGCGFGWHCKYVVDNGAAYALGIDLSQNMIEEAERRNNHPQITYKCIAIEDFDFQPESFDVVISSLSFHYLESFDDVCIHVNRCLSANGAFVFSVEHPVFTAYGSQDWIYDKEGNRLHWPVDKYFYEGKRDTVFLGEEVIKYHKTLTTYINGLIKRGFRIIELIEPEPEANMHKHIPEMKNELRRPMMLIISAIKEKSA